MKYARKGQAGTQFQTIFLLYQEKSSFWEDGNDRHPHKIRVLLLTVEEMGSVPCSQLQSTIENQVRRERTSSPHIDRDPGQGSFFCFGNHLAGYF